MPTFVALTTKQSQIAISKWKECAHLALSGLQEHYNPRITSSFLYIEDLHSVKQSKHNKTTLPYGMCTFKLLKKHYIILTSLFPHIIA